LARDTGASADHSPRIPEQDWGCAVSQSERFGLLRQQLLVPRDSGAGPARSVISIGRFDEPQE